MAAEGWGEKEICIKGVVTVENEKRGRAKGVKTIVESFSFLFMCWIIWGNTANNVWILLRIWANKTLEMHVKSMKNRNCILRQERSVLKWCYPLNITQMLCLKVKLRRRRPITACGRRVAKSVIQTDWLLQIQTVIWQMLFFCISQPVVCRE